MRIASILDADALFVPVAITRGNKVVCELSLFDTHFRHPKNRSQRFFAKSCTTPPKKRLFFVQIAEFQKVSEKALTSGVGYGIIMEVNLYF